MAHSNILGAATLATYSPRMIGKAVSALGSIAAEVCPLPDVSIQPRGFRIFLTMADLGLRPNEAAVQVVDRFARP